MAPCAWVASWCRLPVACVVWLCESVRAGNTLLRTCMAAVIERSRLTGIIVMVADGLRSGKREEAATNTMQHSMVKGISNSMVAASEAGGFLVLLAAQFR